MQLLIESLTPVLTDYVEEFIDFMCGTIGVEERPVVTYVARTGNASFGHYQPSTGAIVVATEGRHIADTLRTLGHEIVHHKQMEAGEIDTLPLLDLERDANAVVGLAMRDYNKLHPELYGVEDALPDDQLDQEGESQGAMDSDTVRPSGPISMAEDKNMKASHVGTCVNSFDRGTGECTVPHLPYRDASHFASGVESSHTVSREHFLKHANVPKHLEPLVHKKSTEFLHDKEHGVHMMHDHHKDVHHFFTEEMTAGAGDVAGIGIGSQGEPGVPQKKKKTLKMFRRKLMEYNDKARTVNDTDAKKRLAQARTIFGKVQKK